MGSIYVIKYIFPNSSAVRVLVGFKGVTIPSWIVRLQPGSAAGSSGSIFLLLWQRSSDTNS